MMVYLSRVRGGDPSKSKMNKLDISGMIPKDVHDVMHLEHRCVH